MKKFLVGFGGTLLLLVLATYVWSLTPRVKDPKFVERALAGAEERFQSLQAKAKDPAKNAYLNKAFLPVWGMGNDRKGGSPAENALNDWLEVSGSGDFFDHVEALKKEQGAYLKARSKFLEFYPQLAEATGKECFVAPGQTLDLSTETPDYLKVRDCAQGLVSLSQSFLAEGRGEESVRALKEALQFAGLLQGQSLIGDMIATAVRGKVAEALGGNTDYLSGLSAEQWSELAGAFHQKESSVEEFGQVMETEMVAMLKSLDGMTMGKPLQGSVPAGPPVAMPFLMHREKRMLTNQYVDVLKAIAKGQPSPPINFSWWDWLLGRTGILSSIAIPSYEKMSDQLYFDHARQAGLFVAATIQSNLLETGSLPKELELLQIAFPAEFPLESFDYTPSESTLFLKLPRDRVLSAVSPLPVAQPGQWMKVEENGLRFKFGE